MNQTGCAKETIPKRIRKTSSKSKLNFPEHKAISLQNECIEAVMQELEFSKNKPSNHHKMNAPLNKKKTDCNLYSKDDNVIMHYSTCNVQLVMSIVDEIIIK